MPTDHRTRLAKIRRFDQLIAYLRDEMDWPIESEDFEQLTFDYTAEELGIDKKNAAKIQQIKRLRPLEPSQPWGIFFVKFEPKRVQSGVLRSILGRVVIKKRASANIGERQAWAADDLLFISAFGADDERRMVFAHFSQPKKRTDIPVLKVVDWDQLDTALHLDDVARKLTTLLAWPDDTSAVDEWRERWQSAFELRPRQNILTSKDLSIRLAELARAVRDRIKTALSIETESGKLTRLMKAFQTALVDDLDSDGFADMYAQTIAYGLLSARITDPHKKTADDFAAHMRTNPFLRELMETFLKVGGRRSKAGGPGIDFDELGVSEVVDLLDDANMEAVVRDFGDRNPQEDPVIHFYELFLKEYDAEKRMQRGVFYTPRPVVSYIVRSVDKLLRSEFGLTDGLADTTTWAEMAKRHKDLKIPEGVSPRQDFVQILDPATGTGTFLVEVIALMFETLVAKWKAQGHGEKKINTLWNEYVPKHLLTRLHGYELLMAPYAIAHLKVGLKLYETGYSFGSEERARIYLTNALEPASGLGQMRLEGILPALAHEAQDVDGIKRSQRFSVVIGNPPYAAISSNLTPDLRRIVDPFRFVDGERIRERSMLQFEKNIQDDYVKFFAFAQERQTETSTGICSMISNHSYLDGPTLRGMRWTLLDHFPISWFLDLHGNANKAEIPPEGIRDKNVFDIRQGVAICVLAKPPDEPSVRQTRVADRWGERDDKYKWLSSLDVKSTSWTDIEARPEYYYLVKPDSMELAEEWSEWPSVCDVFGKRSTGTETGFDNLLVDFEKSSLKKRIARFGDPSAAKSSLADEFDCEKGHAAELFRRRREFQSIDDTEIRRFQIRAYDYRWAVLRKNFLKTNSFNVMLDLNAQSPGLVTTRQTKEQFTAFTVKNFCGHKLTSSYDRSYVLPLFTTGGSGLVAAGVTSIKQTFLDLFLEVMKGGTSGGPDDKELSLTVFKYTIAVLNAPSYSVRFGDRLRRDWPKVPMPGSPEFIDAMKHLGGELTELHLMESPKLEEFITEFVGPKNPQISRVGWSENTVWIDCSTSRQSQRAGLDTIGFKGVPEAVWKFKIGGYQVCEKWLKDRRGRKLSKEDIAHYQKIVVAISETIRVMRKIDDVIEKHGGWPGAFRDVTDGELAQERGLRVAEARRSRRGRNRRG